MHINWHKHVTFLSFCLVLNSSIYPLSPWPDCCLISATIQNLLWYIIRRVWEWLWTCLRFSKVTNIPSITTGSSELSMSSNRLYVFLERPFGRLQITRLVEHPIELPLMALSIMVLRCTVQHAVQCGILSAIMVIICLQCNLSQFCGRLLFLQILNMTTLY